MAKNNTRNIKKRNIGEPSICARLLLERLIFVMPDQNDIRNHIIIFDIVFNPSVCRNDGFVMLYGGLFDTLSRCLFFNKNKPF